MSEVFQADQFRSSHFGPGQTSGLLGKSGQFSLGRSDV